LGTKTLSEKKLKALEVLHKAGIIDASNVKQKCCKKYKKSETKRCKKCPCYDIYKTNNLKAFFNNQKKRPT
jgi:hypothetical protein